MKNLKHFYFKHFDEWRELGIPVKTKYQLNGDNLHMSSRTLRKCLMDVKFYFHRKNTPQLQFLQKLFFLYRNKSPVMIMIIAIIRMTFKLPGGMD